MAELRLCGFMDDFLYVADGLKEWVAFFFDCRCVSGL